MTRNQNNITRQNYEEWFMDYLDGQLDQERELLLIDFVNQNPDLKAELESIQYTEIPTLEIVNYPHKQRLLKSTNAEMDIPESDFLFVKRMEDGLSQQETARLKELLDRYPELNNDELLYNHTILYAPEIVYGNKESLGRKNTVWIWPLVQGIVAAAILLILILPGGKVYQFEKPKISIPELSEAKKTQNISPSIRELLHVAASEIEKEPNNKIQRTQISHNLMINEPETGVAEIAYTKLVPINPIAMPHFDIEVSTQPVDAYETGLAMMIPTYINNQRIKEAQDIIIPEDTSSTKASLLEIGSNFVTRLTQKELAFRKVYDTEGNVIAINVKSGDFEMLQRVPRLLKH